MAHAERLLCVNEEDVLISRGANPRTGLISPFVSDNISHDNDGTDYVRARNTRKASVPTRTLPDCSRPSDIHVNQESRPPSCQAAPSPTGPLTHQVPPTSADFVSEIPRKPVGSPRVSSTPTSKRKSGAAQVFSNLKRISGSGKKLKGAPSPASLGIENDALGPHAYPSVSTGRQSTTYDRTRSLPTLQLFSSDENPGSDRRNRNHDTLNDYVASVLPIEPLLQLQKPDLGKGYRRPKMLLPEHLQRPSMSPYGVPRSPADLRISTSRTNHPPSVTSPIQRPQFKRVPASSAIHRLEVVGSMATSTSTNQQSFASMLPESRTSEYDDIPVQKKSSRRETPSQSSDSTYTAPKTICSFLGHSSDQKVGENPQPQHSVKQSPPLLSLNGVLFPDQAGLANDCRIRTESAKSRDSPQSLLTTVQRCESRSGRTFGAQQSARSANETWKSVLAVASEIVSLIDFARLQRVLLKSVKHGALAARRTPWAARTLMSQDADIKTYLIAARCMMVTALYLVMSLSVFAVGFRLLELLVEIGHCIYCPFGVLLRVVRWILTP
ncbi:MAG: hypothetical protein Q9169_003185 [Polycauliona sp. 2 TL-2023]